MTNNQTNKKHNNPGTTLLVLGTWGLVIVAIWTQCDTRQHPTNQLEETRRFTELAYRPFLSVTTRSDERTIAHYFGDTASETGLISQLHQLKTSSDEFNAVNYLLISLPQTLTYHNTGNVPLRITRSSISSLSEQDWIQKFYMNSDSLVKFLYNSVDLIDWSIDFVILPDEKKEGSKGKGKDMFMPIQDFKSIIDTGNHILLYPYIFIEYVDLSGSIHNVLQVKHRLIHFTRKDNLVILDTIDKWGIEKYRWDVFPH